MLTKSNWGGGHLDNPTNKKGFTLVELLAVIIIIALVSLIAIPIIANTLENAKKKSFEDSVMLVSRELDNYTIEHDNFNYSEGQELTVEQIKTIVKHNFKSGSYIVKNGVLEAYFITDGKYCAKGPIKKLNISKDCYKLDDTESVIDKNKLIVTSTSNSISVTIQEGFAKDLESGIKEYQISLKDTNKSETITEEGTVNFNGIETGTYTVVVDVINNNDIGLKEKIEKEISTKEIDTPTYTVTPTGWAQEKSVAIDFKDTENEYNHQYSLDSGLTWKTYEGTLTFNDNGSVIARVNDGTNYVSGSSQTVSGIDLSKPTSVSFTYATTINSITVTAIGVDEESDITHYQFSSDNGTNWTAVGTNSTYTFNNLDTGKYEIKVRVINGTYTNVGSINYYNYLDSVKQDIVTVPYEKPTYTVSPNGWSQDKTITIDYKDTNNLYTHEYSIDSGSTWEPYEGALTLTTNGTVIARVTDGTNYVTGTSETISTIDRSAPTSSVTFKSKTSKSITIEASGTDLESDIYGYQYSNDDGSTWSSITTNTEYTFNNLTTGTYSIKVRTINRTYANEGINNLSSTESTTLTIPTTTIDKPTYVVSPSGWSQDKTITILYPEGYINEYSLDSGSTWYTYSEALTFSDNGTVIARVTDGTNYVSGTSETISTIDTSAPTVANVTRKSTTSKSITVIASGADSDSDIYGYQFSSDDGTTWSEVQTDNEYTFNNLSTGTYNIKSRVINNTYGNNGINANNSLVSSTNAITTNSIAAPTYSVSPNGWAQSKTVTITYPEGYTNEYSTEGGAEGTWQTYTGPIEFNSNGTIIARVTDVVNYVTSSSQTVSEIDTSAPTAATVTMQETTSKSIKVLATGTDGESNIYGYQFSRDNGSTWSSIQTSNEYVFNNLTSGTYNIKVKVVNNTYGNNGISNKNSLVSSAVSIVTNEIITPEYEISPSRGWAQSKTVTIIYPEGYTNEYSTEGGAEGTWKSYTDPIEFNSNGTIIARVNDGVNYVSGSSQTVSEIDGSAPTVANVTKKSTTSKSITVTASGADGDSDIYGYQFSKDNGSTWTNIQTDNEYTFNNLTTGTYNIKAKVINNTYGNNGINNKNSLESSTNTITTNSIAAPTYSTSPSSGWAQSKTVTITYPEGYTNEYSREGGAEGTWQTYTGPVTFTKPGTILARVTDGTNTVTGYISGSSYTVSEVDSVTPTAGASVGTRTTTSAVVNATCTAGDSGITKIEYSKDNGSSYVDRGTDTSYTFTGLSQGTSYNFKVRCTNGVGTPVESGTTAGVTKATAVFDGNGGSNGTSITADVGAQLGTLSTSSRSYTITYDLNSTGATRSKTSETVTYTFDGWYTGQTNGTQISSSTTMPSGGKTYYAHWSGGTTTLATITKTGYTCTWNTKSDGTGTSYASGKTSYAPTSTHTLYARCSTVSYTISYTMNSGTNNSSNPTSYTIETATITLKAPTRSGYHFDGWSPSGTITKGSTGNKTFTATWSEMCGSNKVVSSYGSWGDCSKKCGTGTQYRNINYVSKFDSNYSCGTATNGSSQNCNTQTCCSSKKIGSYGNWSGWGDCSKKCGTGTQTRTRTRYYVSNYDGSSCGSDTETGSQNCNTQTCCSSKKVGSYGNWSGWSSCSASCGSGTQTRTRTRYYVSNYDGSSCGSDTETGSQSCYNACWYYKFDYTTADNCWYGVSAYSIPSCYTNCYADSQSHGRGTNFQYTCKNSASVDSGTGSGQHCWCYY